MERFGKDQHALLIRQLFHIYQVGSMQEYIDKYNGLVEQLIAYGRNTDPLYYAMRFVDGLGADIRAAVHLQRPATLILPAWSLCCRTSWWSRDTSETFGGRNHSPSPRRRRGVPCPCLYRPSGLNTRTNRPHQGLCLLISAAVGSSPS